MRTANFFGHGLAAANERLFIVLRKKMKTTMHDFYETKISDGRWWAYDIPGNAGWIIYYVCVVRLIRQGMHGFTIITLIPAVLMLLGILELISERIAKLDRILPKKRLLRGFGALTLGGILGAAVSVVGWIVGKCGWWMLSGSVLCAVFAGLLYKGYRKAEDHYS